MAPYLASRWCHVITFFVPRLRYTPLFLVYTLLFVAAYFFGSLLFAVISADDLSVMGEAYASSPPPSSLSSMAAVVVMVALVDNVISR